MHKFKEFLGQLGHIDVFEAFQKAIAELDATIRKGESTLDDIQEKQGVVDELGQEYGLARTDDGIDYVLRKQRRRLVGFNTANTVIVQHLMTSCDYALVVGPSYSGKTTFANRFTREPGITTYDDADQIKADVSVNSVLLGRSSDDIFARQGSTVNRETAQVFYLYRDSDRRFGSFLETQDASLRVDPSRVDALRNARATIDHYVCGFEIFYADHFMINSK